MAQVVSALLYGSFRLELAFYRSLLSGMLKESEQKSEAKTAFISRMSHELRTPLHGLLSAVSLLSQTSLTEDQLSLLKIMNSCGDLILDVIFRILDITKIESGKFETKNYPFNLLKMVSDLASTFASLAESKKLELLVDFDLSHSTYDVFGDRPHIHEILTNVSPFFFSFPLSSFSFLGELANLFIN